MVRARSRLTLWPVVATLFAVPAFVSSPLLADDASDSETYQLHGKIRVESGRPPALLVSLFHESSPFPVHREMVEEGDFRFRSLPGGTYVLVAVRTGLGELRRTVHLGPESADRRGIVEFTLDYSAGEAAANASAGMVSLKRLMTPPRALSLYRDAQRLYLEGNVRDAVRKLTEAVHQGTDFAAGWVALGIIAQQRGQTVNAENDFRQALTVEPGNFEAALNLGGLLLRTGRAEQALPYLHRAVEKHPLDALANAQLGKAYFSLTDDLLAEHFLLEAKRIDPQHFSYPQIFLAAVYARHGDPEAVTRELSELIRHAPDSQLAGQLRRTVAVLKSR